MPDRNESFSNVDRRVLARLQGCKLSNGTFEGALCTKHCQHRESCKVKRFKFLIQARNIKAKFERNTRVDGVHVSIYQLLDSRLDEYIDERTGAVD
ncbi:Uncharacterised protein [uncultured archaeon]|nr:Uncharacterised protein [uncultured archaeon]